RALHSFPPRRSADLVAAAHLDGAPVVVTHDLGRADLALDLLGGAVADQQVVLRLDVRHYVAVEVVAGDAQALGYDDAAQADDRQNRKSTRLNSSHVK